MLSTGLMSGVSLTGVRPALKSAPAFGGIARIMAGEQGSADDGACEY